MFRTVFIVLSLTVFAASGALASPMVHQKGSLIVDGQDKSLKLRECCWKAG